MKGDDSNFHSPARGLADGFNVGGGSTPPAPTYHPDVQMSSRAPSSALSQPSGTEDGPTIGGVGATSGAVPFAQLVTSAPSDYDSAGDPMVGGLGKPPTP